MTEATPQWMREAAEDADDALAQGDVETYQDIMGATKARIQREASEGD